MRSFGSVLRRFIQNLGYDVHRIGGRRLGRNHFADICHLCRGRGVQTVFDVGANTGRSAIHFSTEFPSAQIYSFEPFSAAFGELSETVKELPRVRPINIGLGERAETRRLFIQSGSELNSLLPPSPSAVEYIDPLSVAREGECEIQITTLDAFCVEKGIEWIDLLKIDTQGSELSVLRGSSEMLRKGRIKTIFLEVNFVPLYEGQCSFSDIISLLDSFHCCFVGFYEPAFADEGFLKWADALFVRPGND